MPDPAPRPRPVATVSGCVLIAFASAGLLFLFGMATLAGGAFPDGGPGWWRAVLAAIFSPREGGTSTYALLAILALGVAQAFRPPGPRLRSRRGLAWTIPIALFVGLSLWSASYEHVVMVGEATEEDGTRVTTTRYENGFGRSREVRTVRERGDADGHEVR